MSSPFYITTTLPYVNAEPHIGFALEIVAADVIARSQHAQGKSVFFNTGTDEHGQKIYERAQEQNQNPQDYVNHYAEKFKNLQPLLHLSSDLHFIRTTDPSHVRAAQAFWKACAANTDESGKPDIYKAEYEVRYCIGCELEKQASELVDDRCPLHPAKELELRKEENYFFRFSRYQQALLELYKSHEAFVLPEGKLSEISAFVANGLQDFSISRVRSKMPWGVPVPNDEAHVMYVWFDALINYISTLGWPTDSATFAQYWPGVQIAGKDNLRQQAAMWQAMLLSAGLPNSQQILINGFISVDGQKMSKSVGNVISPAEMVARYGSDATRYLLMRLGPIGEDMDVSWNKFDTSYTAELSNGLGNLCSRVATLCARSGAQVSPQFSYSTVYLDALNAFDIAAALGWVHNQIREADHYLSETTPWKKSGTEQVSILENALHQILSIAHHLEPFMPETAAQIKSHFSQTPVRKLHPLFPRLTEPHTQQTTS